MHSFVRRENLRRYRNLLVATSDEAVRSQLFKLIAEEERRQLLQRIAESAADGAAEPTTHNVASGPNRSSGWPSLTTMAEPDT